MLDKKIDFELYKNLKDRLNVEADNHSGGSQDELLVDVLFDLVNNKNIMGKDWVKRLGVSRHRATHLLKTIGDLGYLEAVKPHSAKPRESYLTKSDLEAIVTRGLMPLADLSIRPMYEKAQDKKPSKFGDSSMFKMPTSDYSNLDSSVKVSHVKGADKSMSTKRVDDTDTRQALQQKAVAKLNSFRAAKMQKSDDATQSSSATSFADSNTMVFGPKKSDNIQTRSNSASIASNEDVESVDSAQTVMPDSSEFELKDDDLATKSSVAKIDESNQDDTMHGDASNVMPPVDEILNRGLERADKAVWNSLMAQLGEATSTNGLAKPNPLVVNTKDSQSGASDKDVSNELEQTMSQAVESQAPKTPAKKTTSEVVDGSVSQRDYLAKHFLIHVDIHSKDIFTEVVLNQSVDYEYTLINRHSNRVWLKNVDYDTLKQFLDAFYLDKNNF